MAGRKDEGSDMRMVLLLVAKWEPMVELLDFFDGDSSRLMEFVDLFGGTTLRVPSRDRIGQMARDLDVWTRLRATSDRRTEIEEIAREYQITPTRVEKIAEEMQEVVNGFERAKTPD